jgi:hypothetical protein
MDFRRVWEPKDLATRNVAAGVCVFALIQSTFAQFADRIGNPLWLYALAAILGLIAGIGIVWHFSLRKKIEYTIYFVLIAGIVYVFFVATVLGT